MTTSQTLQLLRLSSPSLPIGAYAYSQGLEQAVEWGWVHDEASAGCWILGLLQRGLGQLDLPVLVRLHTALGQADTDRIGYWTGFLRASREARELQEEDRALGRALALLLADLGCTRARPWVHHPDTTLALGFALAARHWDLEADAVLTAYAWSWIEHQVSAAVKLIPLGQTAGQRVLAQLLAQVPPVLAHAGVLADDDLGSLTLGQALACAAHETQYTRLFRS